ncbi:hypothetical protein FAUST_3103 [Fusarium austroamericanum]|uniref:NWD NACHT-NTPase N-terminal domain-containing protein n=1 Tax=Fusarium austroamericanum TaxID=282268 RepID=A0AAN6C5M8_FUSAU|nr:hypothetical protein FAUST_3103 [Fusarium austroamericanum]
MKSISSTFKAAFRRRRKLRPDKDAGTMIVSMSESRQESSNSELPIPDTNIVSTVPTIESTTQLEGVTSQALSNIRQEDISLWNSAYERLKETSEKVVTEYEELLSKELSSEIDISEDESENHIDDTNHERRKEQLELIIQNGLRRTEEGKIKYKIFGKTFIPRYHVARTAEFVQSVKTLVDEAVKASPEAGLVWAGVCTVLPILINPSSAESAQQEGFTYVTSRMRFYGELERYLWPARLEAAFELKREVLDELIGLYQHILEFQITLVVQLYKTRLAKLKHDIVNHDIWNSMVSKLKQQEAIFDMDLKKINDLALRMEFQKLNENAEKFFDDLKSKLSSPPETQRAATNHHSGFGDQFNASGGAMQTNNTGGGDQYVGVSFYGSAGFGRT